MEKLGIYPDLEFRVKKIGISVALAEGFHINPDRLEVRFVESAGKKAMQVLLLLATQEETVGEYPNGWWQAFKEEHFPDWLKRRYPVKKRMVVAVHKFPDIDIPNFGRERIHLKVIPYDEFVKDKL